MGSAHAVQKRRKMEMESPRLVQEVEARNETSARLSGSETWVIVRKVRKRGRERNAPLAQWHPASCAGPDTVDPCAVSADDDEDKSCLFLLVLDPGVETRHVLQGT